jgi:hypothetical protein
MTRSARDHEIRAYFTGPDYARVIQWADIQDRSIANFTEHAVRRYLELLEEQDIGRRARESMPPLRRSSDEIG